MDQNLGRLRTTPVNIGGTTWKPQFPIGSQIEEELLNQPEKTKTEIAIERLCEDKCLLMVIKELECYLLIK